MSHTPHLEPPTPPEQVLWCCYYFHLYFETQRGFHESGMELRFELRQPDSEGYTNFFLCLYKSFMWLGQVLVAAHGIFDRHCGKQVLFFFFFHAGSYSCRIRSLSCSMWKLISWPGIRPRSPALGAWNLSYWTTREVPRHYALKHYVMNVRNLCLLKKLFKIQISNLLSTVWLMSFQSFLCAKYFTL